VFSYYLKLIGQFYQDMRRQKLRTFFTVFGITWGTAAVVLLLAFGVGLERQVMKGMHGLGTNIVIFGGRRTAKPFKGLPTGRWIGLREEDAWLLAESIPDIEVISPESDRGVRASYKRNRRMVGVAGIHPGYGELRNLFPENGGRFINALDIEKKRRVVFIGNALREKLFGQGSKPEGKVILLNGIPFTVIGVMLEKSQDSAYMGRDRDNAFIPFTTYNDTFSWRRTVNRFICRAQNPTDTPRMKKEIFKVLGRKYKFDPEDEEALWIWDTTEMEQFFFYFFLAFNLFLGIGGVLTLLVGGIGVANIMYVVVRERRRELGIKAAVGATPRTILFQFLTETFIIVAIGGTTGFLLSIGIIEVYKSPIFENIHQYVGTPVLDPLVTSIAVGILGLVGFAAGLAPARRAANMDPVQALEF